MEASTVSSREGLEDQIRGCAEPTPLYRSKLEATGVPVAFKTNTYWAGSLSIL